MINHPQKIGLLLGMPDDFKWPPTGFLLGLLMINLPVAMIFTISITHLRIIYDIVWGACSIYNWVYYITPFPQYFSQFLAGLSLLAQP